jgi:alanine racemase
MPRPLYAQLNLTALQSNLAQVRSRAPNSQVLAVVKANAYGHGLGRVLPGLADAEGLALLELDAAVDLALCAITPGVFCCSRAFLQPASCLK